VIRAPAAPLGEVLSARRDKPDPEEVAVGRIPIVAKVSFEGTMHLREDGATKTQLILVEPGDLLVSGINGAKGAIALHGGGGSVAATIHYSAYEVRVDRADPMYLWWFLRSDAFRHILVRRSPSGIKAELRAKRLLDLPVPLPPLDDQRRLVIFFSEVAQSATRASELAEVALERSSRLLVSCIDDVMGRLPVEGRLEDVLILKPRAGPSFPTDPDWQGTPVLMPSAVTGFNVDPARREYGIADIDVSQKDRLEPGDVLIARGNKVDQVGNAGVVPEDCSGWVCANLLMRTVVDSSRTLPAFLVYWLRSSRMRHAVKRALRGTSPSIQKINQRSILAFPYPAPVPLARQDAIVSFLREVEDRAMQLQSSQRDIAARADRTLASVVTASLQSMRT
jgi:type I restriction enzyme, S subunit